MLVSYKFKALIVMAEVPTYPSIPSGTLQCCSGKTYKSYPLVLPGDDVPQGFSDLWQGSQIVMLLHQLLVTLLFRWMDRPNNNLTQIQSSHSRDELY